MHAVCLILLLLTIWIVWHVAGIYRHGTETSRCFMIDQLREDSGETVEFCADNEDFNDHDNCLVVCTGEFTGWEPKHFEGATLNDALTRALIEKRKFKRNAK